MKWYVEGFAERSNVDITLNIPDNLGRLCRDVELVVFRIVQECLTNIHRHSDSKNAEIRLGISDGIISVTVRDNGKRMSVERLAEIRSNASGVGIRGMRERLRQLGGEISIESDASGTTVLASLPVPSPQKDQSN